MARRLALWALLLTTWIGVLGAEDWRVAIVSLTPKADLLLPIASESAGRFAPRLTATDERQAHYRERLGREADAAYDKARARLYAGGETDALRQLKREEMEGGQLPTLITYTPIPYEEALSTLLSSGGEVVEWYLRHEGLDGLITLSVEEVDVFDRVVCTVFEEEEMRMFDRLVERGSYHLLTDAFNEAMLSYGSAGRAAALLVEGGPPSLRILLDGEEQAMGERLFFTEGTEILLSLSAPYHHSLTTTVSLEAGRIVTVDGTLESEEGGPVTLTSRSGAVNWFVDGVFHGNAISLGLDHVRYPLSILVTKEGFAAQQIALSAGAGSEVMITMEGELTRSSPLLEREQEDFYKALRSTILLFGAYVATHAIGNTVGFESEFWPVAQMASGAVAMVNLVAFAAQLAAYGR